MVKYLHKKTLTSTLECGVFAAEKSCFFLTKENDFIILLREISAANFIFGGVAAQEIFAFFIKKTVDFETF